MSVEPAPENFGIKFRRTDLGENAIIDACVDYVTTTSRGPTLENGEVKISTLEHLMASLYGLRIDNALISIDSQEVPILDGSALPYVTEFIKGGIEEQQAERRYFTPKSKILYRDPKSGSELVVMPDDEFNIDLMIDFNSKVLGNQYARLTPATDFASEIAPCRTFVFFHELEPLFKNNLIKGGDLDNAIVIVEHHVDQKENVCQHGDNVAEPQPSDLVVFILVIIGVQGSDGFFVGLVELYYIICALGDEQQERCREGNDEMQPVFASEE